MKNSKSCTECKYIVDENTEEDWNEKNDEARELQIASVDYENNGDYEQTFQLCEDAYLLMKEILHPLNLQFKVLLE